VFLINLVTLPLSLMQVSTWTQPTHQHDTPHTAIISLSLGSVSYKSRDTAPFTDAGFYVDSTYPPACYLLPGGINVTALSPGSKTIYSLDIIMNI
jgi:hypothetical protein